MTSAIVILNYNSTALTMRYAKTVAGQGCYDAVVVVDNASTEPAAEELDAFCREQGIVFLRAERNRGYSAGNNLGAAYAAKTLGADVIVISNPDIICPPETVERILAAFAEEERLGVVTGLVHSFDKARRAKPFSAFAFRVPTYGDLLANCFLFSTVLRNRLHASIYYDPQSVVSRGRLSVECVSGCYFAIRRSAYEAVGGFDEEVFLYHEEAVLGYRLKEHGYRALVLNAPVYHDEDPEKASSLKKQWRTHRFMQDSATLYLRKYRKASAVQIGLYRAAAFFGFWERALVEWITG